MRIDLPPETIRANIRDFAEHRARHALIVRALSRREFLQATAGATALGAAAWGGLSWPLAATAAGPGIGDVVPIANGAEGFGGAFHVYGPPAFDSPDSDPSTVGNFNGAVGLAYISGNVTEKNRKTGAERSLPFNDADMRFMQGVFRDETVTLATGHSPSSEWTYTTPVCGALRFAISTLASGRMASSGRRSFLPTV